MLFLEPIVMFFSLYMSAICAFPSFSSFGFFLLPPPILLLTLPHADVVLFGDLVAYAYIFEPYNLSDGMLGVTFLSIVVGLLIMGALTPLIYQQNKRATAAAAIEGRPVPPEEHLRIAMLGTWFVVVSSFLPFSRP
jgi:hypothetical protein